MSRRGTQLSRRIARRTGSFSSRRFAKPIQRQLVGRERLFKRAEQEEARLIAKEKAQVDKLIADVNAGRISNLSQIPERYRSIIGVTQTDLNNIQNYYTAKKEADLWANAYHIANKVLTSTNPSAIFAIAFSDNPYVKQAYKEVKESYKAYQERSKLITDIRAGKITDVAVVGNRIINTKTGVPITPTQISKKEYADLINKELPGGDKLILDNQYNIKGIDSRVLGMSVPYNQTSVIRYQKELGGIKSESTIPKKTTADKTKFSEVVKFIFTGSPPREQRLLKEQDKINKEIERFNNKYGEKSLSPEAYREAEEIQRRLQSKQDSWDRRYDSYGKTYLAKLRAIKGERPLSTIEFKEEKERQERGLAKAKRELAKLRKSNTPISRFRAKGLEGSIKGRERELERLKQTRIKRGLIGSPVPFAPVSFIPKGVTNVKFVGSQKKLKDGKVVTDIIFKTSKGEVGYARGVQVSKGAKGKSIVLGQFGQKGVQFPTNIQKIKRVRTFVGKEFSITKPQTISVANRVRLVNAGRITKPVTVIKKNVDIMAQGGVGRVITVRGKKLFRVVGTPTGNLKRVPGKVLSVDDFASISAVVSKKDLNFIVGKAITSKGAKANFVGIIKGVKDIKKFDLTGGGVQQYTTALNKVISTTASALAQTNKVGGVPKTAKVIASAEIISRALRGKPTTARQITKIVQRTLTKPPTQKQIIRGGLIPRTRTRDKLKTKITIKLNQKQMSKLGNRLKNKIKQQTKITSKEALRLKQALRLKLTQNQIQRLVSLGRIVPPQIFPVIRIPIIFGLKLPKGFTRKILKEKRETYYVVIKIKGKKVNLTPRPLTLNDAKDFLAYRVDNGLSRSAWFEPLGKNKVVAVPPKSMRGYFNKISKKLRPFKIRVGRKRALRRGYIEKTKYIADTPGEKRALRKLSRRGIRRKLNAKQRRIMLANLKRARRSTRRNTKVYRGIPKRRFVKRRISPKQRRIMLANLKRARAIRMRRRPIRKRRIKKRRKNGVNKRRV